MTGQLGLLAWVQGMVVPCLCNCFSRPLYFADTSDNMKFHASASLQLHHIYEMRWRIAAICTESRIPLIASKALPDVHNVTLINVSRDDILIDIPFIRTYHCKMLEFCKKNPINLHRSSKDWKILNMNNYIISMKCAEGSQPYDVQIWYLITSVVRL